MTMAGKATSGSHPDRATIAKRVDVGILTLSLKVWPAVYERSVPAVLLPATGATAKDWDAVATELSQARTVYAVDLRGHGDSDWPGDYSISLLASDVVALLDQLTEPLVDVVGHSLGGLVACKVVAERPGRVRRLVLEDVPIPRPRIASMPARPAEPLDFDWRLVEQIRPEIDDPDPRWVDIMRAIQVPTLVIGGGDTSPVPQDGVRELVSILPRARLKTIEAGHLVHAMESAQFIAHITEFLDDRLGPDSRAESPSIAE